MNVYLVVEIKYREFLSRLLVGATSAMHGNDVFIGDDEIINAYSVSYSRPKVVKK